MYNPADAQIGANLFFFSVQGSSPNSLDLSIKVCAAGEGKSHAQGMKHTSISVKCWKEKQISFSLRQD